MIGKRPTQSVAVVDPSLGKDPTRFANGRIQRAYTERNKSRLNGGLVGQLISLKQLHGDLATSRQLHQLTDIDQLQLKTRT